MAFSGEIWLIGRGETGSAAEGYLGSLPGEIWPLGGSTVVLVNAAPAVTTSPLTGFFGGIQNQQLTPNYGTDVYCTTDLDPYLSLTYSALPQDLYHMISTPAGSLFFSPASTMDLRDLLSEAVTPGRITAMQGQIADVIAADERVTNVQVVLTFSVDTAIMNVSIAVTPIAGQPFTLIMQVSKLSIQLLNADVVRH
jgi:hypothetical protein